VQKAQANVMTSADDDHGFTGSIPNLYEQHLVPLIFEPYSAHLANQLAERSPGRVLEIAAGTGVATRSLASLLPENVSIVATDLNQPMLDQGGCDRNQASCRVAPGRRHAIAIS
jgi:predicted O-methyltransferase YrrM